MKTLRLSVGIIAGLVLGIVASNACSAGSEATAATGGTSGTPTGATSGTGGGGATATGTSTNSSTATSTSGVGGAGGSTTSTTSTTSTGAGGSGGVPVDGGTTGAGGDEDAACAAVSSEANAQPVPADIIIAVDTSGSMDAESAEVQQNLNAFATIISNSGIDAHVIMIASSDICIPAPLGSGACGGADEKLPGYRHVVQSVGSTDALQVIINTYPQWQPSLRANASKTFLVVTDDDSDMSAQTFTSALLALDPPTFQGFKFNAVAASTPPESCLLACAFNCGSCNNPCCDKLLFCAPLSAAEGSVYKQLVQQTGSIFGDLCAQDFDPIFQSMATAVVNSSPISCEYDIPSVPDGGAIDPEKVNVAFSSGGGPPQTIGNVPSAADCTPQLGGWYYDNPQSPTQVILCPTTCTAVQGDPNGKIEVLFGCATIHQ